MSIVEPFQLRSGARYEIVHRGTDANFRYPRVSILVFVAESRNAYTFSGRSGRQTVCSFVEIPKKWTFAICPVADNAQLLLNRRAEQAVSAETLRCQIAVQQLLHGFDGSGRTWSECAQLTCRRYREAEATLKPSDPTHVKVVRRLTVEYYVNLNGYAGRTPQESVEFEKKMLPSDAVELMYSLSIDDDEPPQVSVEVELTANLPSAQVLTGPADGPRFNQLQQNLEASLTSHEDRRKRFGYP